MQKRGVTHGLDEARSAGSSEIAEEIKLLDGRSAISRILRRHRAAQLGEQLPTESDMKRHIENVFSYSESSQPSRALNAGAGVADVTSVLLAASNANVFFGTGIVASELVAWAKNRSDTKQFLEARKTELSELESHKSGLISELKSKQPQTTDENEKRELRKLIKETKKLFSDIESKSGKGLTTAQGSRLEGIAGSLAALASSPLYEPFANNVSGWLEGLIRSQPFQPQPFHPEPLIAAVDLAVTVAFYLGASAFLTYGVDWVYEKLSRSSSLERREGEKENLRDRAGELLRRISQKCGTP